MTKIFHSVLNEDDTLVEHSNGTCEVFLSNKTVREMSQPEPTEAEQIKLMKGLVGEDFYNLFTKP